MINQFNDESIRAIAKVVREWMARDQRTQIGRLTNRLEKDITILVGTAQADIAPKTVGNVRPCEFSGNNPSPLAGFDNKTIYNGTERKIWTGSTIVYVEWLVPNSTASQTIIETNAAAWIRGRIGTFSGATTTLTQVVAVRGHYPLTTAVAEWIGNQPTPNSEVVAQYYEPNDRFLIFSVPSTTPTTTEAIVLSGIIVNTGANQLQADRVRLTVLGSSSLGTINVHPLATCPNNQ